MKRDQKKRLQAAAKRRLKRQATAQQPLPHPSLTAPESPNADASADASADVIAVVLSVADDYPNAVTNQVIQRACRSFLKFKSPQDEASRTVVERFENVVKSNPPIERALRDALGDLADQASAHLGNEDSDDHSLLAFLRTVNQ